MISRTSTTPGKRDLHVGGLGAGSTALSDAMNPMVEPIVELSDTVVRKARDAAHVADDYVHDHPWVSLGLVALLGVTAGYLLSRRF